MNDLVLISHPRIILISDFLHSVIILVMYRRYIYGSGVWDEPDGRAKR